MTSLTPSLDRPFLSTTAIRLPSAILALLVCIILSSTSLSATVYDYAQPVPNAVADILAHPEITAWRTPTERHFDLGNGQYAAIVAADAPATSLMGSTSMMGSTSLMGSVRESVGGSFVSYEGDPLIYGAKDVCVGHFVGSAEPTVLSYRRAAVDFPLPSLPHNATVDTATFYAAPDGEQTPNGISIDPAVTDLEGPFDSLETTMQITAYEMSTSTWQHLSENELTAGSFPAIVSSHGTELVRKFGDTDPNDDVRAHITHWDITSLVQAWVANPSENDGIGLGMPAAEEVYKSYDDMQENGLIPATYMCFPRNTPFAYATDSSGEPTGDGFAGYVAQPGMAIIVEYNVPTLTPDTAFSATVPTVPLLSTEQYVNQGHKYNLPTGGSRWRVVEAHGSTGVPAPDTPLRLFEAGNEQPRALSEFSGLIPNYAIINPSVADQNNLTAQVLPQPEGAANDHNSKLYELSFINADPLAPMPAPNFSNSFSVNFDFSRLAAREMQFAADTTVEIRVISPDSSYEVEMFPPITEIAGRHGGMPLIYGDGENLNGQADQAYEIEFAVSEATAGDWLMVIARPFSDSIMPTVEVTICPNDSDVIRYPLKGECLEIHRPDDKDDHNFNFSNVRVFSPSGFSSNKCELAGCTTLENLPTGEPIMPMIGVEGNDDLWVAVKGGTLSYNAAASLLTTSADSRLVLVDFSTTPPTTLPVLRGQFNVSKKGYITPLTAPADTHLLVNSPMHSDDDNDGKGDKNGWEYAIETIEGRLYATGSMLREVQPTPSAAVNTFTFDAEWSIAAAGGASLLGNAELTSLAPSTVPFGSLRVESSAEAAEVQLLGHELTHTSQSQAVGEWRYVSVRRFNLVQPTDLGGAFVPTAFDIYVPGVISYESGEPNLHCGDSCFYMRSTSDEGSITDFEMPDIIVSSTARTALLNGQHLYSSDFSADFSFEAFNATIRAERGFCSGTRDPLNPDVEPEPEGSETLVIRGVGIIGLPGIGQAADASSGVGGGGGAPGSGGPQIKVAFELCQTSLREVSLEFSSQSVAIPLGNSGLFMSVIGGTISITPTATTIVFHIEMRATAPTVAASTVFGRGYILISTLGYVNLRVNGMIKITNFISYNIYGNLGVGWSPLDLSFEVQGCLPGNIGNASDLNQPGHEPMSSTPAGASDVCTGSELMFGLIRAALWRGCGFNNRYPHLACDDRIHFVGEYEAVIGFSEGMIINRPLLKLPPNSVDVSGVALAIGEFCSNGPCTQYERGVLGARTLFGFDVGIYVNLTTNISDLLSNIHFHFGNVGYCLIDEIGPGDTCSQPVRNVGRAAAPQYTLNVANSADSALFAIGHRPVTGRHPTLTLFEPAPGNRVITLSSAESDITITQIDETALFAIDNPTPGDWEIHVNNHTTSPYEILFAANATETIQLTANSTTTSDTTADICWTSDLPADHGLRLNLYFEHDDPASVNSPFITPRKARGPIIEHMDFAPNSCYEWDMAAQGMVGTGETAHPIRVYGVLENSAGAYINETCGGATYSNDPSTACSTLFNSDLPLVGQRIDATGLIIYDDDVPPPAPTLHSVLPGDTSSVMVRFSQPAPSGAYTGAGLSGFSVTCKQDSVTRVKNVRPNFDLASGMWETVQVNGLIAGESANCGVQTADASNNLSVVSNSLSAIPTGEPPAAPPAPGLISVASQNSSSVDISWAAVSGASGYLLFYDVEAGGGRTSSAASFTAAEGQSPLNVGNVTHFSLTDLAENGVVNVSIKAYDSDSNPSDSSQEISHTIGSSTPTVVQMRGVSAEASQASMQLLTLFIMLSVFTFLLIPRLRHG